jgi:hypothetical protein
MKDFKVKPVPRYTPSQFNKPVVPFFQLNARYSKTSLLPFDGRLVHDKSCYAPNSIRSCLFNDIFQGTRSHSSVILSLAHRYGSYNNFSFHELLVAISGVKLGEDIRIIPPHDNQVI